MDTQEVQKRRQEQTRHCGRRQRAKSHAGKGGEEANSERWRREGKGEREEKEGKERRGKGLDILRIHARFVTPSKFSKKQGRGDSRRFLILLDFEDGAHCSSCDSINKEPSSSAPTLGSV